MYTEAMYFVYSKICKASLLFMAKYGKNVFVFLFELLFISHFIHW